MVRLWIREDGEQPKAIGLGATAGRGPGRVVDVDARSVVEARAIFCVSLQAEPIEETDPLGWLDWRRAQRLVHEVI